MGAEYKTIIAKFPEAYAEAKKKRLQIASLHKVNEIIESEPNLLEDTRQYIGTGTIAAYQRNPKQGETPTSIAFRTKRNIDRKSTKIVFNVPSSAVPGSGWNFLISPGFYEFEQDGDSWIFRPKEEGSLLLDFELQTQKFQAFSGHYQDNKKLEGMLKNNEFKKRFDSSYAGPVFTGGMYDKGVFSTAVCPVETHRFFLVKPDAIDDEVEEAESKPLAKQAEPLKTSEPGEFSIIHLPMSEKKYASQLRELIRVTRAYDIASLLDLSFESLKPIEINGKMCFEFKGSIDDFTGSVNKARDEMLSKAKPEFLSKFIKDFFYNCFRHTSQQSQPLQK